MKKTIALKIKNTKLYQWKRTFTVLISMLFIFSAMLFDIPTAHGQVSDNLPEKKTALEDFPGAELNKTGGQEYVAGEVLVKFKKTMSQAQMQNTLNSFHSSMIEDITGDNLTIADVPEGQTVESFIQDLKGQANVEYAQPNYIYRFEETVNDQYESYQWYLDKINVHEAWDDNMGSSGVTVAVLDTGADLDHPDLLGQVDLYHKVVAGDNSLDDDKGHGTHVSGIIAAATNNSIGVAGIAPNTRLIVVDVFQSQYNTEESQWEWGAATSDIITGITYARSNGADIINMSLGGYDYDAAFEAAINAAVGAGVVCIASAGNDGDDPALREANHYPSDYEACISVISTDPNDAKSGFSNYGPQKDISAPGGSSNDVPSEWILSTYTETVRDAAGTVQEINQGYWYSSGTSMASPVVAGVVALMLTANPDLTVVEVKDILYDTAVDLGTTGRDDYFGYGRVDAQAAVLAAEALTHVTSVSLNKSTMGLEYGASDTLTATVYPVDADNKNVTWDSSDTGVATVDASGNVDAVDYGTTTITVTTEDGGHTDTCEVTVIKHVDGVTLNKETTSLYVGDEETLTATVSPSDASDKSVSWSSDNTDAATADSSGKVTAVGKGTATITATTVDGNFTDTCEVTVMVHAASVSLDKSTMNLEYGAGDTLMATVYPVDADNKNVTWDSSDTGVATVDASGNVDAVDYGTTTITVTTEDGGHTDTCEVTVIKHVDGVTLNKETTSLYIGDEQTLTATVSPSDASDKSVSWSSDNTDAATVDSSGKVTAVGKGIATITVTTTDGSFTDTCEVTVMVHAASVSLNKSTMNLEYGAGDTLTATVYPVDADNKNVTWDSNDTGVATVDASGNVDAVDYGTTTITVTTEDGGHTDTCEVTVIKHVDGVTLNKETASLYVGDEQTLTATVSPSDASNKSVSWSSNNTNAATVDSSGKVKAVGKGTATITVTTNDGSFTDTCEVSVDYNDIRSDIYTVDQANGFLRDIALNTSAAALKANLKNDSSTIFIYDMSGQIYTGDKIKTGMKIKFIANGIVKDELKAVILGDSSGDGNISIIDYTLIRLDILELKSLSGEFWKASDVNKDGKISIIDYTLIRLHILELKSIH